MKDSEPWRGTGGGVGLEGWSGAGGEGGVCGGAWSGAGGEGVCVWGGMVHLMKNQ